MNVFTFRLNRAADVTYTRVNLRFLCITSRPAVVICHGSDTICPNWSVRAKGYFIKFFLVVFFFSYQMLTSPNSTIFFPSYPHIYYSTTLLSNVFTLSKTHVSYLTNTFFHTHTHTRVCTGTHTFLPLAWLPSSLQPESWAKSISLQKLQRNK